MLLKRKRSDSEISNSSNSILSSPPPLLNALEVSSSSPSSSPFLRDINAPHLSSRTRKRFRDNRPPDAKIHQHTLSMLYSAQKNQQPSHTTPQVSQSSTFVNNGNQQTSLHSFWSLPSRTPSYASTDAGPPFPPLAVIYQAANCEDCETPLVSAEGDAMDIDIDVDSQGSACNYACSKCQKLVCHRCAISNLGADRRCLMCAGKRAWVGGIGWIDQD